MRLSSILLHKLKKNYNIFKEKKFANNKKKLGYYPFNPYPRAFMKNSMKKINKKIIFETFNELSEINPSNAAIII